MPQARRYRGIEADERLARRRRRFIEAGLDLLGGRAAPDDLTVRAICAQSGLTPRYFYESFSDKDDFVEAVFGAVTAELATATQAAVSAAPASAQNRAGIATIVRTVARDPRIGRLLFSPQLSNAVILRMRAQHEELAVILGAKHIRSALRVKGTGRRKATTNFVLGGMRQTISAWSAGDVALTADELVDLLVALLGDLNNPALFRDSPTSR
jgi:AcrR family transcriptional regulator